MIDLIMGLLGDVPSDMSWIVGIMAIILFTFVTHIVFEIITTLFGLFGGDHIGRGY